MDILLWRHAEAVDINDEQPDDLLRPLSARGIKQAQRMAKWLDIHLPDGARILCSPALRCVSTAEALRRKHRICSELAPDGDAQTILELAQWPDARTPALIIGHQPILGQLAAQLLSLSGHGLSVRKGSVWWLRNRTRLEAQHTIVHCVQSPDMLW